MPVPPDHAPSDDDAADLPAALDSATRSALRAQAHHLKPVVMIGEAGLTEAVLAEADRALASHELIKLRVFGDDRQARESMMNELCHRLGCSPVQSIGKLLVVWRARPDGEEARSSTTHRRKPRKPLHKKKAEARIERQRTGGTAATAPAVKARSGAARSPARAVTAKTMKAAKPAKTGTARGQATGRPVGTDRRDESTRPSTRRAGGGAVSAPASTRSPASGTGRPPARSPARASGLTAVRPTGARTGTADRPDRPDRPDRRGSTGAVSRERQSGPAARPDRDEAPRASAPRTAAERAAAWFDETPPPRRPAADRPASPPASGARKPAATSAAPRRAAGPAAAPSGSRGRPRAPGAGLKTLTRLAPAKPGGPKK